MAQKDQPISNSGITGALWIVAGATFLGLLFARIVFPELLWLTILLSVVLIGSLAGLVRENQKALRSRAAAYGLNSLVTVLLVFGIVGVLNFLTQRYPLKWDVTQNKLHSLSDQTVKLVKGLQKPVKAVYFAKIQQKEQFRPLLENYKGLNPKFELEFVDPDREPTRAKQAAIKKYGTLFLAAGTRESRVEDISEEKITNAMIKLLKDKVTTLCSLTGHGEKSFNSQEAEGYFLAKKSLNDQSYEVKDLNLLQEGKVPENCDAIAILGPTKSFFEPEVKAVQAYLENGGRAIVATDINLKGTDYAPELKALLKSWYVQPDSALVVDPLSRMLGVDSSVAILANFNRDNPIAKDFQTNCAFPFARPLDIVPGAPPSLKVQWLAQTTPKSWGVTDLKELQKGQVSFKQGQDKMGPINTVITIDGKLKDSKATRNTRMVVFGSSFFATNNFSRFMGNMDFFLNSISWTMEDESLISIRTKEEAPGKVELSEKAGSTIFLFTVIILPFLISSGGIGVWFFRRRL